MARTSAGGIQPSEVQNSVHTYAEDAEASDAYAITLTPAVSAYTAGQMFLFKANTANSGSASLNVNGLGAKTIKKHKSEDLVDNDIKEDSVVSVVYDGTNFQMISMLSNAPAGSGDMTKAVYDTNNDGTVNKADAVEGTGVLSTGEAGGTKFLREDGDGTCSWQTPSVNVADGDKGDITVSASGATWTIDNDAVTYAKMQDVSATSRVLGRITAGAGDVEELTGDNVRTIANVEDGADVTDATNVGTAIHGAAAKTTPVDADTVPLIDSAASNVLKKVTWANIKATLKTYLDTLYAPVLGADDNYVTDAEKIVIGNTSGTNTGDQTLPTRDSLGVDTDDSPQFAGINLGHASDTTITRVSAGVVAIEGVNVLTTAGGTLTGNITLGENTSVDLDPALSADGKYSGTCITGTAGAALAFGDIVYFNSSSKWVLADADTAAAGGSCMLGVVVLAASGDTEPVKVLLHGNVRADTAFPTFTVGGAIYLSTTDGDVTQTAPTGADDVVRVLGHALTADSIVFMPSASHITHVGS